MQPPIILAFHSLSDHCVNTEDEKQFALCSLSDYVSSKGFG